jgi:hypothetical protein
MLEARAKNAMSSQCLTSMLASLSDRRDATDGRSHQSIGERRISSCCGEMARPLEGVRPGLAATGWRALIQGKGNKDKLRLFCRSSGSEWCHI